MSKHKGKHVRPSFDEDGMKRPALKDIKRDKDRKRSRNLDNALKSRNLDMLNDYADE